MSDDKWWLLFLLMLWQNQAYIETISKRHSDVGNKINFNGFLPKLRRQAFN